MNALFRHARAQRDQTRFEGRVHLTFENTLKRTLSPREVMADCAQIAEPVRF
jgi:hypothetical protein